MVSITSNTDADATNHNNYKNGSSNSSSSGLSDQILTKETERHETRLTLIDNRGLEKRLEELKQLLNDVCKENSLLKMKSAVTLGRMRLEIDSLLEDRNFLIEKYYDLTQKSEELTNDRITEEQELTVNEGRKRTYSV
jgi:hypothetical protein